MVMKNKVLTTRAIISKRFFSIIISTPSYLRFRSSDVVNKIIDVKDNQRRNSSIPSGNNIYHQLSLDLNCTLVLKHNYLCK